MYYNAIVTGFEAFEGRPNPSGQIARELDGKIIAEDVRVIGRELPEDFYKLPGILRELVRKNNPQIVISTGWDYISKIKVEKVALNVMSSEFGGRIVPDNYGQKPKDEAVVKRAPLAMSSTFPADEIVKTLNHKGIPAFVSYYAGTHCCNTTMYASLNALAKLRRTLAGFIHIPPIPEMNLDDAEPMPLERERAAIESALITCRNHLKRQKRKR